MKARATKWRVLAAATMFAVIAVGCAGEPYEEDTGVYDDSIGRGTTDVAYGAYDAEITPFLERHYRDYDEFADDNLAFDVREGIVSVRGEVDSIAERDRLVSWVDEVPGVREVNATGLTTP